MSARERALAGLDPEQRTVVEAPPGPLLVVAGPGSGKTRVIAHRAALAVVEGIARPAEILACTFTNRAAEEMAGRIEALVGEGGREVWCGTIHAACHALVRPRAAELGRAARFSIASAEDSRRLFAEARRRLHAPDPLGRSASELAREVAVAKARGARPAALLAGSRAERALGEAWLAYRALCRESSLLDFEDLVLAACELLRSSAGACAQAERYRLVLVDEYQDVSVSQAEWVTLVARSHGNVTVVVDPIQAIYGWRGADAGGAERFLLAHPGAARLRLHRNYRSAAAIVRSCARLRAAAGDPAPAVAEGEGHGAGSVRALRFANELAEAEAAASWAAESVRSGTPADELAVLARTRRGLEPVERALRSMGVACRVLGGAGYFERAEVRDALAFLHLAHNPRHRVAFERAASLYSGVGRAAVARVRAYAAERGITPPAACLEADAVAGLSARQRPGLERLGASCRAVEAAARRSVGDACAAAITASGAPARLGGSEEHGARAALARLAELREFGRRFEAEEDSGVGEFLGRIALASDRDQEGGGVALATIHAAKGLEWDRVWVLGLAEGSLPHHRAGADVSEERRLAYVAATRPRSALRLSYAKRAQGRERRCSRFLRELSERDAARSPDRAPRRRDPHARTQEATPWKRR